MLPKMAGTKEKTPSPGKNFAQIVPNTPKKQRKRAIDIGLSKPKISIPRRADKRGIKGVLCIETDG